MFKIRKIIIYKLIKKGINIMSKKKNQEPEIIEKSFEEQDAEIMKERRNNSLFSLGILGVLALILGVFLK